MARLVESDASIAGRRAQGIEPSISRPQDFSAFIAEPLAIHRKLVQKVHPEIGR
jgi:hypothetical protein